MLFVVINEQGPAWDSQRWMRDQMGWDEHARFMAVLEAERFVVLGGPLKGHPKHRAMLVVEGRNEQAVRKRLAEDPWIRTGVLKNIEFYSWEILLGKLS